MKTINLFLDFEFTSLSPDAQIISLGIVSEDNKSFYSEFTDFDINRCDDWVKENVVGKLKYRDYDQFLPAVGTNEMTGKHNTEFVKIWLRRYLSQFSDYQIQIVVDCGTWDWYHFLQLVAEWDEVPMQLIIDPTIIPIGYTIQEFVDEWKRSGPIIVSKMPDPKIINIGGKIGLPKLPSNISPVPQDLNDLILYKYFHRVNKNATIKDAFDANRETILYLMDYNKSNSDLYEVVDNVYRLKTEKHNSLWDAKIIKAIYKKLM